MAGNSNSGFGSNSPVQQRYVSAKGGRKKVPKGLARIDPERALEIRRMGGLKRQQQLKKLRETNFANEVTREEKNGNKENSISSRDTSNPS